MPLIFSKLIFGFLINLPICSWKELFDQLTKLMENHLFNDKYGQKDSYEQKQVHGFALILSEFGDRFKYVTF